MNRDELQYAQSIEALIVESDDVIKFYPNGDIKIDIQVFDDFEKGSYIDIYICDKPGFITSSYTMKKEDEEGILFAYNGESRE